jgi:hypothetical protein
MRRLVLIPILVAAAVGACSQSLTHDLSGAGGTGTGGVGATGGVVVGSGGSGGSQSLCATLASDYQVAVVAAQACTGGLDAQCQQVIPSSLSACGSCPTYVTDPSEPNAIQQAWLAAGCNNANPAPPCFDGQCPTVYSGICVIVLDTNHGACVSTTTPGTGGSSPDGGSPCEGISQKYAAVLPLAKSCTPGATDQCGQLVPTELAVCSAGCTAYVNDATELNTLRQQWNNAGCSSGPWFGGGGFTGSQQPDGTVSCPNVRCQQPLGGGCATSDAGGASCVATGYAPL